MGAGCLLLLRVTATTGYGQVAGSRSSEGGYGLLSAPMAAATLGAAPRERAGMESATKTGSGRQRGTGKPATAHDRYLPAARDVAPLP
jgi:hypothetical protein